MSYAPTFTIATPCVVSWGAVPPADGTEVAFSTTGALPTGLVVGTSYYVDTPVGNNSNLRTTQHGVTLVNTSGTQSGTHYGDTVSGVLSPAGGAPNVASPVVMVSTISVAVRVTISNIVVGCQVRVADGSNNEIYNALATTSEVSFTTKVSGAVDLTIRGISGGTLYKEFSTPFNIDPASGASVYVNQVVDGTA